jgi:hypothetical protein
MATHEEVNQSETATRLTGLRREVRSEGREVSPLVEQLDRYSLLNNELEIALEKLSVRLQPVVNLANAPGDKQGESPAPSRSSAVEQLDMQNGRLHRQIEAVRVLTVCLEV